MDAGIRRRHLSGSFVGTPGPWRGAQLSELLPSDAVKVVSRYGSRILSCPAIRLFKAPLFTLQDKQLSSELLEVCRKGSRSSHLRAGDHRERNDCICIAIAFAFAGRYGVANRRTASWMRLSAVTEEALESSDPKRWRFTLLGAPCHVGVLRDPSDGITGAENVDASLRVALPSAYSPALRSALLVSSRPASHITQCTIVRLVRYREDGHITGVVIVRL
ncbi:uncharacterized protein B0H18DRAFT_985483 [Fomitopsis serialis]|uniref:uncharacterized protein n=1 Tax=Fomitopsis serialis TaxID=139415 RepID=UPI002007DD98|nr:uncharacterized protein B0H18DRAFT_985483 [Neoantrodia serialis]KAH9932441.1 hypothetical protein B0H18DRAFT_985483 [Neoantrodia serialis]